MQHVQDVLPIGSVISGSSRDRYIVRAILGKGGSSTIYLVRDQRVKQNLYALKEVIDADKREANHLAFEYEILTRLEHPSLPRVYRVFEDTRTNRTYILMDYIEGPNLAQLQKQSRGQKMTLAQIMSIMAPIVDAISFLHHQEPPIVHRDIKPSNIIVPTSGDKAYLVDFGIAKLYATDATTTAIRHFTPGYAAPEQYGTGTTPSTDIYGLGATFYTLLTGKTPVESFQRMILLSEKESDPLERVDQLVPTISSNVADVIQRAMALRRTDRFETVEEFWHALQDAMGTEAEKSSEPYLLVYNQTLPDDETDITEGGSKRTQTFSMRETLHTSSTNSKNRMQMIILPFVLLIIVLSIGASLVGAYHPFLSVTKNTHPKATPVQTHTPIALSPTTQSNTLPYPPLATQYKGIISDVMANSKTTMSLTNIHQNKDVIRGDFAGLGLVGTFVGNVDTSEDIHVQITIYSGGETLAMEGNIKVGGSMAGSYRILNSNHEFTGEYGLWSVAPS